MDEDHSVEIAFEFDPDDAEALPDIEEAIHDLIDREGLGQVEGTETDEALARITIFGPNASAIFEAIEEFLSGEDLTADATVTLRFGAESDGAREEIVELGA